MTLYINLILVYSIQQYVQVSDTHFKSKTSARIVRWFVLFVRKYIIFINCQLFTYYFIVSHIDNVFSELLYYLITLQYCYFNIQESRVRRAFIPCFMKGSPLVFILFSNLVKSGMTIEATKGTISARKMG